MVLDKMAVSKAYTFDTATFNDVLFGFVRSLVGFILARRQDQSADQNENHG